MCCVVSHIFVQTPYPHPEAIAAIATITAMHLTALIIKAKELEKGRNSNNRISLLVLQLAFLSPSAPKKVTYSVSFISCYQLTCCIDIELLGSFDFGEMEVGQEKMVCHFYVFKAHFRSHS